MKITIDIKEDMSPMFKNRPAGVTEIAIVIDGSGITEICEAFRSALYAAGYHPDLIDQHVSIEGEFFGDEPDADNQ